METPSAQNTPKQLRICLAHSDRYTREVLAKVLSLKLDAEVLAFGCIEDILSSSMIYDVFIIYGMYGHNKMDGWQGVKWIKFKKPGAMVIFMQHRRFFERKYMPPGTDLPVFIAEDDVEGLVHDIRRRLKSSMSSPPER